MMLGLDRYDGFVDVWSAGLLLSQLFINKYAFPCKSNHEGLNAIFGVFGSYPMDLINSVRKYGQWSPEYENIKGSGSRDLMHGASDDAYDLFTHLCDIDWRRRYTA